MLSIPSPLQNQCRSFLSLKDMHLTRAVCKEWKDIREVPKWITWISHDLVHFDVEESNSDESEYSSMEWIENLPIPKDAVCTNARKLSYVFEDLGSDNHHENVQALGRILIECHRTLQSIELVSSEPMLNLISIPQFENVHHAHLELAEDENCSTILQRMPNVEALQLYPCQNGISLNFPNLKKLDLGNLSDKTHLNLRLLPKVTHIDIQYQKDIVALQNLQDSSLEKISIGIGVTINNAFSFNNLRPAFLLKPSISVYYRWVVLSSSIDLDVSSVVIGFTICKNEMTVSHFCPSTTREFRRIDTTETVQNLKTLLEELRGLGNFEIKLHGLSVSNRLLLKHFISRTGLYIESQIIAMQ